MIGNEFLEGVHDFIPINYITNGLMKCIDVMRRFPMRYTSTGISDKNG